MIPAAVVTRAVLSEATRLKVRRMARKWRKRSQVNDDGVVVVVVGDGGVVDKMAPEVVGAALLSVAEAVESERLGS